MKLTVKLFMAAMAIVALFSVRSLGAAPATWTGTISDSMCGASHGDKGGTMQKDHDCAVTCAKKGGYVFVADKDKKIFKISNQTLADLTTHAGHHVDLTGELKGDTITVTKITMLKK
jgi:hypothetical protein